MSVIVIVNGFAHRLLKNGIVESAPVEKDDGATIFVDTMFAPQPLQKMNLTDGELYTIRQQLMQLNFAISQDPLPTQPVEKQTVFESSDPV